MERRCVPKTKGSAIFVLLVRDVETSVTHRFEGFARVALGEASAFQRMHGGMLISKASVDGIIALVFGIMGVFLWCKRICLEKALE